MITDDETWMHHATHPETKIDSMTWKASIITNPPIFKVQMSAKTSMAIVLWYEKDMLFVNFIIHVVRSCETLSTLGKLFIERNQYIFIRDVILLYDTPPNTYPTCQKYDQWDYLPHNLKEPSQIYQPFRPLKWHLSQKQIAMLLQKCKDGSSYLTWCSSSRVFIYSYTDGQVH